MDNVEVKKPTRGELVSLYREIKDIKSCELPKEAKIQYTLLRVELRGLYAEFDNAHKEISEETKPEGWTEGDSTKEWDEAFIPVMQEWLNAESNIESKIFSLEDCIALSDSNPEKNDSFLDMIINYMKK